jgi:hypothetical protein
MFQLVGPVEGVGSNVNFRLIFFLLVFVNLIFFVGVAGYLGGADEGREPQRLVQQLHPEQLRIVRHAPQASQPEAPSLPEAVTVPATPAAPLPKTSTDSTP